MAIPVIMVALVIVMTPLVVGLLCTAHLISAAKLIHRNHRDHREILHRHHGVAHPIEAVEIIQEHGGDAQPQPLQVVEVVHRLHWGHHLMNITEMIHQQPMLWLTGSN
ncbi:uncharacterized protein LOC114733332 [Neltuma alba]|uniref:uncharacterized protein LOC114733332 n=1 Tax=Neltuma alba TaxID=207710 RepID=UPI0010A56C49|nr:uncharacterized protein LOC114733332 [Prosopis alba]